jgi:hypothetical protein
MLDHVRCLISGHDYQFGQHASTSFDCGRGECKKCGAKTFFSKPHDWRPAQYVDAQSCVQTRTCNRCGREETLASKHVWGDWQYVDASCTESSICNRCAEPRAREHHDWRVIHEESYTETVVVKGPGPSFDADRYEEEQTRHVADYQCARCHATKHQET